MLYKHEFKFPRIIIKPGTTEQACNPLLRKKREEDLSGLGPYRDLSG